MKNENAGEQLTSWPGACEVYKRLEIACEEIFIKTENCSPSIFKTCNKMLILNIFFIVVYMEGRVHAVKLVELPLIICLECTHVLWSKRKKQILSMGV